MRFIVIPVSTFVRLLSLPQSMNDDLRVVFESRNRRACADRALVLASLQIPHRVVDDTAGCALIVPAEFSAQAMNELRLYDEENPPHRPRPVTPIVYQDAIPGVVGYILVICAVAWFSSTSFLTQDWLGAGRVDGVLIRAGEWWRTVTALTLHGSLRHLVGNIVFGAFFGLFAGRLLGSGVAWLAILLTAASGNALNMLLLESTHRSIGASTAVFAALGIVAGFVWRGKLMAQDRWPYRVGPIVGGFALLMYTGTGDANTDIGAHLMGFLCGLAGGMLLIPYRHQLNNPKWQIGSAAIAIGLLIGCWFIAFLR
jgi:membrane associated rhomboid family serine protease